MKTVGIKYRGILLNIVGTYYGGFMGSMEDPPEPPEFVIDKIYVTDSQIDILNLFDDDLDLVEELVIENIQDTWM